jgi:hypothetical protein
MRFLTILGCVLALFPLWPIMAIRLVGWGITAACDYALGRATWFHHIGAKLEEATSED